MPRIRRILPFSAAVAVAATLVSAPAAAAAPGTGTIATLRAVSPGSRTPTPDDGKLTDALLGQTDLPSGFKPQPDAIDDLFARIPAEITACGKAAGVPGGTVYREYVRGTADEELLVETLAAPGAKQAAAAVTALGAVLPGCTAFTRAAGELPMEMGFTLTSYQPPKIGDASAGIAFVMKVPSMSLTVNGRLIAATAHGTHVTVMLMSEGEPKVADLEATTRAAVKKLPAPA